MNWKGKQITPPPMKQDCIWEDAWRTSIFPFSKIQQRSTVVSSTPGQQRMGGIHGPTSSLLLSTSSLLVGSPCCCPHFSGISPISQSYPQLFPFLPLGALPSTTRYVYQQQHRAAASPAPPFDESHPQDESSGCPFCA